MHKRRLLPNLPLYKYHTPVSDHQSLMDQLDLTFCWKRASCTWRGGTQAKGMFIIRKHCQPHILKGDNHQKMYLLQGQVSVKPYYL